MGFDGAGAEEQLGGDLPEVAPVATIRAMCCSWAVSASVGRAVRLRGCSPVARQLAGGTGGERVGAHVGQHVVGGAELVAGVQAAAFAPQPLAVDQVRPGQVAAIRQRPEVVDRPAVVLLRCSVRRGSAPLASALPARGPRGCRWPGPCGTEPLQRGIGDLSGWPARAAASISSGERVAVRQLVRFEGPRRGVLRRRVLAPTVVEHRQGVLPRRCFPGRLQFVSPSATRSRSRRSLGPATAPGGQDELVVERGHLVARRDRGRLGRELLGVSELPVSTS